MNYCDDDTFESLDEEFRDARDHTTTLNWNYCAKGFLRRGETSVLYGPSNCGKSALVCHLGHCVVTGRKFFGARVKKGMVIHVGAEAPESILDRMQAYDIHHLDAAPYRVRMKPVDLSQPDEVSKFIAKVKRLCQMAGQDVILIVFDTLARSIGFLDENCANAMTQIAEAVALIARVLNAHVMLVHHTGKDADRGGRGSSALRGAVDSELSLKPLDGGAVVLSHEKQRTMPKGLAVQFRMETVVLGKDEDGEDRTTVKAVELPPVQYASDKRKTAMEASGSTVAVLTALHIRRLTGAHANVSFRPGDLVDTLPEELFGGIAHESRARSVCRALEKLACRKNPPVEKGSDGWRLVGRSNSASSGEA